MLSQPTATMPSQPMMIPSRARPGAGHRSAARDRNAGWLATSLILLAVACSEGPRVEAEQEDLDASQGTTSMSATLRLTSSAFEDGGSIPPESTCDGENVSPALSWKGAPEGTKSLVLIVDDPDAPDPAAPRMTWVHWVLYDIPPAAGELPRAVEPGDLPDGTRQGKNDWLVTGWGGPCPPVGRHRYFFKLIALDTVLGDLGNPSKANLLQAMKGHEIARTQLLGTYQRAR